MSGIADGGIILLPFDARFIKLPNANRKSENIIDQFCASEVYVAARHRKIDVPTKNVHKRLCVRVCVAHSAYQIENTNNEVSKAYCENGLPHTMVSMIRDDMNSHRSHSHSHIISIFMIQYVLKQSKLICTHKAYSCTRYFCHFTFYAQTLKSINVTVEGKKRGEKACQVNAHAKQHHNRMVVCASAATIVFLFLHFIFSTLLKCSSIRAVRSPALTTECGWRSAHASYKQTSYLQ